MTTPDPTFTSPANIERLHRLIDSYKSPDRRKPAIPLLDKPAIPLLDGAALGFVAEMYGVQLDQLTALLADRGGPANGAAGRARELVATWRAAGYAETGQFSEGEPWVWATRKGLTACSLQSRLIKPAATKLRHTHAVTDVRLALERTSEYREGRASWRAERFMPAGPGFPSQPGHIPDGEVHWPAGSGSEHAGETWAIEVEIARKSISRIVAIMCEVLARTADYGCPPVSVAVPGRPPRYACLVYICSPASIGAVLKARAQVGPPQSARIDVRALPGPAMLFETPKGGE